jgi:hypothetical protein
MRNGKPASEASIGALQAALGCQLSDSFAGFLRSNDGAEPETNIFEIGEKNESGVNKFIGANEILKERRHIENLPTRAYPVAWAEGGNYVFVDEGRNGVVFFWDHETPENIIELAPDFGAFLNLLEPFDAKSIQLKPGQVKNVWVDPEFLKRIKK